MHAGRDPAATAAALRDLTPDRALTAWAAALGLGVVIAILVCAWRSRGFLWEDDYAHLVLSLEAVRHPTGLLDVWGRPLMTAAYVPGAIAGEKAVRVTSLALLFGAAYMCWRIARNRGDALPLLAPLFLLAQPLTAVMGFAALPGTVFSFALAAALWLRSRGAETGALVVASALPLARLEGLVVLAAWAAVLISERKWRRVPLLGVSVLAWAAVGGLVHRDVLWLVHANPYGIVGSPYGSSGWGFILVALLAAYGPLVALLAVSSLALVRRLDLLTVLIAVSLMVFYTVAWGVPLAATINTPLYLVSAGVPVALLCAGALSALWRGRRGGPAPPRWPRVVALAAILTAAAVVLVISAAPLPLTGEPKLASQMANYVTANRIRFELSTEPGFAWYARSNFVPDARSNMGPPQPAEMALLRSAPVGFTLAWDGQFGEPVLPEGSLRAMGFAPIYGVQEGHNRLVLWRRQANP